MSWSPTTTSPHFLLDEPKFPRARADETDETDETEKVPKVVNDPKDPKSLKPKA